MLLNKKELEGFAKEFVLKHLEEVLKDIPEGRYKLEVNTTEVGHRVFVDIGDKRLGFMFVRLPDIPTSGMSSVCKATPNLARFPHVLFIDYDTINEWIVREELEWICEQYNLTPFYLFYTKRLKDELGSPMESYWGNYQAISLTKLKFKEVLEILSETHSDFNYIRMPNFSRYKFWVLRLIAKRQRPPPKFLSIVPEDKNKWNLGREVSRVHLNLLRKWYKVPEIPYTKIDNSEELIFIPHYLTTKI